MKTIKTQGRLELLVKKFTDEIWLGGFLLLFSAFCLISIPNVLAQEWSYRFGATSYPERVIVAVVAGSIGLFTLAGGCYNLFKRTVYIFDARKKTLFFGEYIFSESCLAKVEFSELNGVEIMSKELSADKTRFWLNLKVKHGKNILLEECFDKKEDMENVSNAILEITGLKAHLSDEEDST